MADEVSEPWLNASVFDESACSSILLDDFIASRRARMNNKHRWQKYTHPFVVAVLIY